MELTNKRLGIAFLIVGALLIAFIGPIGWILGALLGVSGIIFVLRDLPRS